MTEADVELKAYVCANCAETFYRKGRRTPTKYCGSVCRSDAHNKKVRAEKEAKRRTEEANEAALEGWCRALHKTWASKAQCLWPSAQVEGEGQYAVVREGPQVTLYGTRADAARDSIAGQVVVLHRGVHRRGQGR